MRLIIERSQDDIKGVFGGHKGVTFTLSTRVEFTEEERRLLDHYKMWGYSVFNTGNMPVTLQSMVQGRSTTFEGGSLDVLLNNENVQKKALDQVPILLDLLKSFGGAEVVNYPRSRDEIDSDLG